jgi:hypothetical protein
VIARTADQPKAAFIAAIARKARRIFWRIEKDPPGRDIRLGHDAR